VSRTEAFYFALDSGTSVFALLDRPAEAPVSSTGVLICPPWGWDEAASYRSRRDWAKELSADGHPSLRFDLPAAGDSGGDPTTTGLVPLWIEAIHAGAKSLRTVGGASRVALLGVGLGALLAQEALARGVFADELICWGAPPSGRHFAREAKAFAAMQADRLVDRNRESPMPPDWLEAHGFVLSSETLAALKALRSDGAPGSGRALLIGRDGIYDSAGRERLQAVGAEVSEDPGIGWGRFVGHPETTRLPPSVEQVVRKWLTDDRHSSVEAAAAPVPATGSRAIFSGDGAERSPFAEEPLRIVEAYGDAFGILTQPEPSNGAPYCAVFLNAGAIRHVGPNRMWVEAARDLAAAGIPSLRVDLESIGEADGDPARRARVSDFYDEGFVDQVVAVLDQLERQGVAGRFRLVGLCAGAYWAFRTALVDDRVEVAVLINAGALVWHPGILGEREGRRTGRVLQRHWWGRLLRGEIRWFNLPRIAGQIIVGAQRSLRRSFRRGTASGGTAIVTDLDRLQPGRRILLAFSGGEVLQEELMALGILDRLDNWPDVEVVDLPGTDHTLRSVIAQRAVAELLLREVGRDLSAQLPESTGRQR